MQRCLLPTTDDITVVLRATFFLTQGLKTFEFCLVVEIQGATMYTCMMSHLRSPRVVICYENPTFLSVLRVIQQNHLDTV